MSLRSLSVLAFLLIALAAAILLVTDWVVSASDALQSKFYDKLIAVREIKKRKVEMYFGRIRGESAALSTDPAIVEATRELKEAFHRTGRDQLLAALVEPPQTPLEESIQSRFSSVFKAGRQPEPSPYATEARFADQPYGSAHSRYDSFFHYLQERHRLYDVLLIDSDTGDVIYSILKERDFATSLIDGPYRDTPLSRSFREATHIDRGTSRLLDFDFYDPSNSAPASFVASPVYDGNRQIGVLVMQVAIDELNRITTGGGKWVEEGLGRTGETYIVGSDLRMRSDSRFFIESPGEYRDLQIELGSDMRSLERMFDHSTTALLQEVRTEAVEQALSGVTGEGIVEDYRRTRVLSAFAPLEIEDAQWGLLAEIDVEEVLSWRALLSQVILDVRDRDYRAVPEYRQSLSRAVISLDVDGSELHLQDGVLSALPTYTEILLLLPENNLAAVESFLQDAPYADRVRFITYETRKWDRPRFFYFHKNLDEARPLAVAGSMDLPHGSVWARDIFKSLVNPSGGVSLYVPVAYRCFIVEADPFVGTPDLIPDNSYVESLLLDGLKTERGTFHFESGNIQVGAINGRTVAFVGSDVLKNTRAISTTFPSKIPHLEVNSRLREVLGVDEIAVIGDPQHPQPDYMYHLDLAMVCLANGIVGVSRVVGESPEDLSEAAGVKEAKRFLSQLRTEVSNLGFEILDIDMSVDNLLAFESYANSIPYTDLGAGRTILMPVYSSVRSLEDKRIVEKNVATFRSIGYHVVEVPFGSTGEKGAIHCLVNVLD